MTTTADQSAAMNTPLHKFRVAIVSASGTGRKRTIPALEDSKLCSVVAIHGRDESRLRDIADTFAIPEVFTDLNAMVAKREFDFAVVCSPPFLHREQVAALLDAGIPTLIEKPLASSLADAKAIESYATAADVVVRVAHHLRHQHIFRQITRAVQQGEIGRVQRAGFEWSFRLNRASSNAQWKLNSAMGAWTPLSDAGVHCVDIAVKLFGSGHVRFAMGQRADRQSVFEDVELITSHTGVITHIVSSWLYGPSANQLYIAGTDGYIVAPAFFTEQSAKEFTIVSGGHMRTVARAEENPYREEVEDFARIVAEPDFDSGATTIAEAIQAMQIVDETESVLLGDL